MTVVVGAAGDFTLEAFRRVTVDGEGVVIMPADRTQDEEITRLVGLGATIVSDQRPEVGWILLADPEGNEFDVEISVDELEAARAAEAGT